MAAEWLNQIWAIGPKACLLVLAVAAGVVLVTPWTRVAWIVAALATTGAAALSIGFALQGAPGVANLYLVATLCVLSALALLAGGATPDLAPSKAGVFIIALALTVSAGWCGALLSDDLIAFFAAVETAWLSAVGLTALNARRRGGLNAALRLLVSGGVSAALFLLGVAALGASAQALALGAADHTAAPTLALVGAALIVAALTIKSGVAPFTYWSIAAYGRVTPFALLVIGVTSAFGALAALVHFAASILRLPELGSGVSAVMATVGMLAVLVGSVQAVGAKDVRRLLAYVWASHAGMAILCVALGSQGGLSAALMQMTAVAAAALALATGLSLSVGDRSDMAALDGLATRAPFACAAMALAAVSLMGAPLTIGFLGRWRLIEVAVGVDWWWVTSAVIVTSLAGVFYGGRLIGRMYLRRSETTNAPPASPWRWVAAPALLAAVATIVMGASPGLLLRAADSAAAQVFAASP
jgi:multicomponent Na+:H+ antiporter subunit D